MALPECFGIFWEGIASNPDCSEKCGAQQECLAKFAAGVLHKYQAELGDAATVHALAELTGVKPEAVLLAVNYQKEMVVTNENLGEPVPIEKSDPGEIPVPPPVAESAAIPEPPPVVVADEPAIDHTPPQPQAQIPGGQDIVVVAPGEYVLEPADQTEEKPVVDAKPKAAPKKKKAPPKKKAPAKKKAPPKKKADAAPKKKVPPRTRKKGKETPSNFPKAGAASRVAVPAKAAKGTRATPAKEQAGSRTWSPKYDLARWARERKRNPLVRALPEGFALEREYPMSSGNIHRVVVAKQSYLYRDQHYPTLYAVLKEITGTKTYKKQLRSDGTRPQGTKQTTTWSVTKFFSLAKLMLTLEEERQGKGRSQSKGKSPKRLHKKRPSRKVMAKKRTKKKRRAK